MREIKFRAWDTETKEMSYDFLAKNWLKVCIESPYVELMQYTGLKDRNGKEIYEGDIIEESDLSGGVVIVGGSQPTRKFVVEYRIEDSIGKKVGYNLKRGLLKGLYKGEVIGNIYENPELLEDK